MSGGDTLKSLRATIAAYEAWLDHLTESVQAEHSFAAHHVQRDINRHSENSHSLGQEIYDMFPITACRTHAGKPLSALALKRMLDQFFINEDREYQPPALHPVYKKLGNTFITRDKNICKLAEIFAHGLRPLDEFASRLPHYLEHDPEMAKEIHDLLTSMYNMMFHGMAVCSALRVQYIKKEIKSAPGEYDEDIITNLKPIIDAQEAFAALSL
ncbi:hypothetical protein H4S07_004417 [Coemansia furcata]|uniref:Uncharacterized protein n=1 Tax=Coemansia furcata TaxID=417177 RepID=A0ACC1L9L2_9FUNG|nr:hypothetical protein H4S07_004417 [Coemansia furcata]